MLQPPKSSPDSSRGRTIRSRFQAALKIQLIRYIIIGGCAYLIEMGSLYGLRHTFGLRPVAAVAISFWIGFIAAFILQKLITFKNYEKGMRAMTRQASGYILLVAWNYGFTLFMTHLLSGHLSVYVIRTGVILVIVFWNFWIYRELFKGEQVVA
jgi:putative flippase GtrA